VAWSAFKRRYSGPLASRKEIIVASHATWHGARKPRILFLPFGVVLMDKPTTQPNERRRRFLKGTTLALPAVMTLGSTAAQAAARTSLACGQPPSERPCRPLAFAKDEFFRERVACYDQLIAQKDRRGQYGEKHTDHHKHSPAGSGHRRADRRRSGSVHHIGQPWAAANHDDEHSLQPTAKII
jgi:hypothetical protein